MMKKPKPFWEAAIDRAIERKKLSDGYQVLFTTEEKVRAGRWTTCACGEKAAGVPVTADGAPEDPRLMALGFRFHDWVSGDEPHKARRVLHAIETRAAIVQEQTAARGRR